MEVPAGGGSSEKLVTDKECTGVAVDAAGNVFFTVQSAQEDPGGWLFEVPAGGGSPIELAPVYFTTWQSRLSPSACCGYCSSTTLSWTRCC